MDPTRTGEWIACRRKEKNLTQKELAARLGVTDKAVSRWETGKGYPDVSLLPAPADELGCTVNELLGGKRLAPDEVPAAAEENLSALCRTAGQPLPNERRLFDFQNVSLKCYTRSTLRVDLPSQTLDRNIRAIMDFCGRQTQVLPFLVYPYDRLRFQSPDEKSAPAPLSRPLRDKPGRRLLALAFAVLALGLVFPVMDRFSSTMRGGKLDVFMSIL